MCVMALETALNGGQSTSNTLFAENRFLMGHSLESAVTHLQGWREPPTPGLRSGEQDTTNASWVGGRWGDSVGTG